MSTVSREKSKSPFALQPKSSITCAIKSSDHKIEKNLHRLPDNWTAPPAGTPGQLYTWGRGGQGQLGHKIAFPSPNCALPVPVRELTNICHVAVGEGQYACVLAADSKGRVFSFGNGRCGRLGHGDEKEQHKPKLITALESHFVTCVAAGERHAGVVTLEGKAFTWGSNTHGQLGNGNNISSFAPSVVLAPDGKIPLLGVKFLDISNEQSAVLLMPSRVASDQSSNLLTFGNNTHGQLGLGRNVASTSLPGFVAFPPPVPNSADTSMPTTTTTPASSSNSTDSKSSFTEVTQVSMGSLYSGCVTREGELFLWGLGSYGNLGQGNKKSRHTPGRVSVAREAFVEVACTRGQGGCKGGLQPTAGGAEGPHTIAISTSGNVYTMGTCHKGLLGNLGNKTGAFGSAWDMVAPLVPATLPPFLQTHIHR